MELEYLILSRHGGSIYIDATNVSLPVTYQNAQARFKDLCTNCTTCSYSMVALGSLDDWLSRAILAT